MTSKFRQRPPREGTQRTTGRKSVLICPTCGHESPPTSGDWSVTETTDEDGRRLVYDCPVCFRTVVEQPQFDR